MQDKKKILYVITKGNFGGAQRYVYDLATNLSKSDFDIIVACGNKDGDTLPKMLEEKGIKTYKLEKLGREIKFFDEFKVCKELISIIRSEKPDVLHLNSSKIGGIGAVAGRISSLLEKNYRPKIVFTSHGWGFYEKHRPFFLRIFFYISHWITVVLCDQTIAVSGKTKKDMSFLPFLKNKISVIHNGIDSFDVLEKNEARKFLASEDMDKIIIFSISELHKNKGIDVALKGLALLPKETRKNIVYCIAGNGEEKQNLEKLVDDLKIKNSVYFLGFVENAKKLLSGATIFLFPSRTENLPFAVLEAGSVGLPIIATSVGGVPEVIHDMQNGILVHPKNPKEIAEAILYLLDHQDKQKEFGKEIKKTISNFFSLQKMLEETTNLYY